MYSTNGLYTRGKVAFVLELLGLMACLAGFVLAWVALPA
jgi:hypothetical protein